MKLATRKTETQEMRAPHLQTGHHVICISQKDITTEIYHSSYDDFFCTPPDHVSRCSVVSHAEPAMSRHWNWF